MGIFLARAELAKLLALEGPVSIVAEANTAAIFFFPFDDMQPVPLGIRLCSFLLMHPRGFILTALAIVCLFRYVCL